MRKSPDSFSWEEEGQQKTLSFKISINGSLRTIKALHEDELN